MSLSKARDKERKRLERRYAQPNVQSITLEVIKTLPVRPGLHSYSKAQQLGKSNLVTRKSKELTRKRK